jgi:hypothetical protein
MWRIPEPLFMPGELQPFSHELRNPLSASFDPAFRISGAEKPKLASSHAPCNYVVSHDAQDEGGIALLRARCETSACFSQKS